MAIIKLKNKRSYYAQFIDRSGRTWQFSLHTRDLEKARRLHDDLLHRCRAIGIAVLNVTERRVSGPGKACKQIGLDFGDFMGK